jgi:hypothetical protein
MQTLNFRLIDWTAVTTESFSIAPVNFPIIYQDAIVNGNVFSSSTAPVTYDLVPNVYHIQLNSEATNDWYIQTTGSTVTASAAIVSGSYATGFICSTSFDNLISTKAFGAFTDVDLEPITKKNVGFNDSFILADKVTYTTDESGSLTVPLVPQGYWVTWNDGERNKSYKILVPNSASVDAALCIVTTNNVSKIITPQNSANYGYTATVSDARYLNISASVPSASYAGTASVLLGSVQSASVAQTASYSVTADSASFLAPARNYTVTNLSASNGISASTAYFGGSAINNLGQLSVQSNGTFPSNTFFSAQFGNAIDIEGGAAGFQVADRTNNTHKWQHYAFNDFFRIWNNSSNEFFVMNYSNGKAGFNLPTGSVKNQLDVGGNISCSVITASLHGNADTATSSSFATTASYVKNGLSSSFATTTINLKNTWVSALDGGAGNGINVVDADGSSMGITGGGITISYNPLSFVPPFEIRDVNNATLSRIDGHGNFVCVNSASFSGSLFGTASFAASASQSTKALTASLASNALSSNFATSAGSAGFATVSTTASYSNTSSFAQTASFAFTSVTAAFATNATSAAFATNAATAAFANGLTFTPSLATSSSFATTAQTASVISGTLVFTDDVTHKNGVLWKYEQSGSPADNFYVKSFIFKPDVSRWGFFPCDVTGSTDASWGFEFTQNHYTLLQGYQNLGSFGIDPSGQVDIYGNNGINLHNGNVVIDNVLYVNGLFNPAGGIYDTANGVTAIQIEDDRALYDESGNLKMDFHSSGILFGNWSLSGGGITGSITNAITASTVSPRAWSSLSAGAAVTWSTAQTVYEDRKTLIVTGPTTMSIQNLYNGWAGALKVTNGNTGSLLKISPTPKTINGGTGSIGLTNTSASVDFVAFNYDGTTLYAAFGNNFN